MDNKRTNSEINTITRNVKEIEDKCGNIYVACNVIASRSNQISREIKTELTEKLKEFSSTEDFEDEYQINGEQIEVSQYYESLPKSNAVAVNEFLDNDLFFRLEDETDVLSDDSEKA